jgi:hypothetical protein
MFQNGGLKLKLYGRWTDTFEICGDPRDIFKGIKENVKHTQFHNDTLLIIL